MSGDSPRPGPRGPCPRQWCPGTVPGHDRRGRGGSRQDPSRDAARVTVLALSLLVLILALLLTGLVVGALARLALPGPDPMPIWATILLGWAGSLVGGIISGIFLGRPAGIIISVLAATLVLYLHRRYVQHRPLTGPGARSVRRP